MPQTTITNGGTGNYVFGMVMGSSIATIRVINASFNINVIFSGNIFYYTGVVAGDLEYSVISYSFCKYIGSVVLNGTGQGKGVFGMLYSCIYSFVNNTIQMNISGSDVYTGFISYV